MRGPRGGVQLAYANRGSQLAGIAVGGALLGGIGAVVGGLSGSSRSVNNVTKVVLRFVTDDFDKPKHDIVLLDWSFAKKGMTRDNGIYKEALETARVVARESHGHDEDRESSLT